MGFLHEDNGTFFLPKYEDHGISWVATGDAPELSSKMTTPVVDFCGWDALRNGPESLPGSFAKNQMAFTLE